MSIAGARASSLWPSLEALAPTLAYDAACLGDGRPPVTPAGNCHPADPCGNRRHPGTRTWEACGPDSSTRAADAIAAALPQAERRILGGQAHVVDPRALAPALPLFLGTWKKKKKRDCPPLGVAVAAQDRGDLAPQRQTCSGSTRSR